MDISLILSGHGKESADPRGLIKKIRLHYQERKDRIFSILQEGEKTSFEIASELCPDVSPFQTYLVVNETLSHLEMLKEEGKARVKEKEGKDYYSLDTSPATFLL